MFLSLSPFLSKINKKHILGRGLKKKYTREKQHVMERRDEGRGDREGKTG